MVDIIIPDQEPPGPHAFTLSTIKKRMARDSFRPQYVLLLRTSVPHKVNYRNRNSTEGRHVVPSNFLSDQVTRMDQAHAAAAQLISFLKKMGYSFVTPTPATHLRVNNRPENQRGKSLVDVFG